MRLYQLYAAYTAVATRTSLFSGDRIRVIMTDDQKTDLMASRGEWAFVQRGDMEVDALLSLLLQCKDPFLVKTKDVHEAWRSTNSLSALSFCFGRFTLLGSGERQEAALAFTSLCSEQAGIGVYDRTYREELVNSLLSASGRNGVHVFCNLAYDLILAHRPANGNEFAALSSRFAVQIRKYFPAPPQLLHALFELKT